MSMKFYNFVNIKIEMFHGYNKFCAHLGKCQSAKMSIKIFYINFLATLSKYNEFYKL